MTRTTVAATTVALLGLFACDKSSGGEASVNPTPSATATGAAATTAAKPQPPPPATGRDHPALCKNPPATGSNSAACYDCVERECHASFNGMMAVCSGYFACIAGCECTDRPCLLKCVGKMDSACTSADVTKAQGKCEKDRCAKDCLGH